MLKKKAFYTKLMEILRKRRYFNEQIWNWAFEHDDIQGMRERLELVYRSQPEIFGYCLDTSLVKVGKAQSNYRHLDYYPLVNARAHAIGQGKEYWALNENFRRTYDTFLQVLFAQKKLSAPDKMQLVQYMQLQGHIKEAMALFQKVDPAALGNKLKVPYDYMAAYFDFYCAEEGSEF